MKHWACVAAIAFAALSGAVAAEAGTEGTANAADPHDTPHVRSAAEHIAQNTKASIACEFRCQLDAGPCNREPSDDPEGRSRGCGEEQRRCLENCREGN